MKKIICLLTIFLSFSTQNFAQLYNNKDLKESKWHGFVRHDLSFEGRNVSVIVPNKPVSGNPWIWKAQFLDWHTDTDSILIAQGFHLVFINADNQYGSPKAMVIWNKFYNFITQKYNLQKKVALEGVSRGGLYVYNWAKQNPEKVSCIYAEAPVCDFKSWPAGFGKGMGSKSDWDLLKKEYGFANDDEAQRYLNNPIDGLETLANAKVPVLHTIGLNDAIVPVEENTFPMINKYIRLGGIATVIPCTKGKQTLNGHHFDIETPQTVADFIQHNTVSSFLSSSDFHQLRKGLPNCKISFTQNKQSRVAFLGGSITYNHGWRDSVSAYLIKRFKETTFDFVTAGISSFGSVPNAFRLERDVILKGKIDLLFVEAAVNDQTNGTNSEEQIMAMEGIVRHVRKTNPAVEVVFMHFVDPEKIAQYNKNEVPEVIVNHEKIASYYQSPSINLAKEVTERINNKEFTWENDFKNLHPSPFGQGVYAKSIIALLETAFAGHTDADDKIINYSLPKKLSQFSYESGRFLDASTAKIDKNWSIIEKWNPNDGTGTRSDFVDVPMLSSNKIGSKLQLKFNGNVIGVAVAAGQDAGIIEYRVDRKNWKKYDLFTQWSKSLHLPWFCTLENTLTDGEHTLEIKISAEKNIQSIGNACRIRYFYINDK
jgi:pimeloyl-ACP methyl ester carboxylesterase/lysophospholipase L1-like esterase